MGSGGQPDNGRVQAEEEGSGGKVQRRDRPALFQVREEASGG